MALSKWTFMFYKRHLNWTRSHSSFLKHQIKFCSEFTTLQRIKFSFISVIVCILFWCFVEVGRGTTWRKADIKHDFIASQRHAPVNGCLLQWRSFFGNEKDTIGRFPCHYKSLDPDFIFERILHITWYIRYRSFDLKSETMVAII